MNPSPGSPRDCVSSNGSPTLHRASAPGSVSVHGPRPLSVCGFTEARLQ